MRVAQNLHLDQPFGAEPLVERIARVRSQVDCSRPAPGFDRQSVPARATRWRSQFPFADAEIFSKRLAAAHISEEEFLRILENDEAAAPADAQPAAWFRTFYEAYSYNGPSMFRLSDRASTSSLPLFSFLCCAEPIIDHFVRRLHDGAVEVMREHDTIPFDADGIHRIFAGSLLEAFQRMLAPTMILRLNLARLQHDLEGASPSERFQCFVHRLRDRAFVMQIMREYPVLARQLVRRADRWFANCLMFLRHLARDWPMIRATFAPSIDPGTLVGIQAQLGDSHRGGRSVLIARFSSGLRIVYKPRSLTTDRHFQQFLKWLNRRTRDLSFKTLALLERETYGWVEFVSPSHCASKDGVRRFYERQGGYLALLYLLDGSDCHCENVIACGEHPVIVDVEALFHPHLGTRTPEIYGVAAECLEHSVLRSGLLPIPTRWGDDAAPLDRSGLAAAQWQKTPFASLQPEGNGTDEMQLVRKHMAIRPSANRPAIAGEPVEQIDGDAVVRGFTTVYQTFLAHRNELLDADGPIACFRNDEVRIVLRHTLTYSRLLAESYHPDVLRNALDRDQMFDLLWGQVPDNPHLSRVVTAECLDLWNDDVPLFTAQVGSRDIFASTGERIPDFLPEPSDALVRRRAAELNHADLARQVWLIRASLTTLGVGRARMSRLVPGVAAHKRVEGTHAALIAQARNIGDRLEVLAAWSQNQAGWIGLRHEGKDEWRVKALGPDLYDGTAGIVLFLAYLAAVTKDERYQSLALAATLTLKHQALSARRVDRAIGAFNGWGGLIYVYSHLAVLWDRVEFIDEARSVVDELVPLIDEDKFHDVVGGAAGCIGALLVVHELAPSDDLMSVAIRCGDSLIRSTRRMSAGVGWSSGINEVPLAGFAHGASGIAWALMALSRRSGEPRFRKIAIAALEYERSLFDEEKGRWADLRSRGTVDSFMTAWCHGAVGIGLSRLCMLADNDTSKASHREILQAVDATLRTGFGDNHSLCHGDLGNLDFLLQASEVLDNDVWRAVGNRMTARILDDVEHNGWKCGLGKMIETPGLMTGLAGIGYAMLRLAEPQAVPSVLNLSPPVGRAENLGGSRAGN
jgi:type 2 lantibiotic biosynthesis protein LanM